LTLPLGIFETHFINVVGFYFIIHVNSYAIPYFGFP